MTDADAFGASSSGPPRPCPRNVITDIDGATGAVTPNREIVFTAEGQEVLACPSWFGGKDWEAGAYSPLTNTMYMPLRNVCARMLASTDAGSHYALAVRNQIAPGMDQVGTVQAISAETGETRWLHSQRSATMSLVATGGGLVFGGDLNGRFRAFDQETGKVLWEINLGSAVTSFPHQLRRGRAAVRGRRHRLGRHRLRVPRADPRVAPERREQLVRLRSAVGPAAQQAWRLSEASPMDRARIGGDGRRKRGGA